MKSWEIDIRKIVSVSDTIINYGDDGYGFSIGIQYSNFMRGMKIESISGFETIKDAEYARGKLHGTIMNYRNYTAFVAKKFKKVINVSN